MQNLCVFVSANLGNDINYLNSTKLLGKQIANHNFTLIYGGSNAGLMGILADSVLSQGGQVVGVTPGAHILPGEIAHKKLTQLYVAETMQERKVKMASLADAFIVLPGGLGTLEELFEVWNANKIGISHKPIGLLNINGYFNQFLAFLRHAATQGFVKLEHIDALVIEEDPIILLHKLTSPDLMTVVNQKLSISSTDTL